MRSYLFPPFNIQTEEKRRKQQRNCLSGCLTQHYTRAIWVTTLQLKQPILFHKEDMLLGESESSLALYKKCADFKNRQTKTMFFLKMDNDLHFVSMYLLEQGHPFEANDTFVGK